MVNIIEIDNSYVIEPLIDTTYVTERSRLKFSYIKTISGNSTGNIKVCK